MAHRQGIFPLKGRIQHYSWGGFSFLPQLLDLDNTDGKPFAEYWLGAHPNHPAMVLVAGKEQPLHQFVETDSNAVLGAAAARRFGSLPYLLKVLDVRQMLSIQVHPNKASAEVGFAAENEQGVPLTAPNRNYKDDNHKPELMVALSDFWLLHGFRTEAALNEVLEAVPELRFLQPLFAAEGYEGLYRRVMCMPQQEVNAVLQPLLDRIVPQYRSGALQRSEPDFWAARAAETYCRNGDIDRGIFSIYLFNLLQLRRGEGVFQGAQMPHAYLEGQNVELMANSDNVLRAGLTDKYIDVAELLRHVRYEPTTPVVLGSHLANNEQVPFQVPASEFELYHYRLGSKPVAVAATSAETLLVLAGKAEVLFNGDRLELAAGAAAFVTAGTAYQLQADAGTELYRAAVPETKQDL